MINIHSLSVAEMREALAIKEEIEALQSKLDAILGAEAPPVEAPARGPGRPRKRHMSPAARARLSAAAKARWANAKAEGKSTL